MDTILYEQPEVTDRELVTRTLAGDKDAFAGLHRKYYARVFRHALYRTRNTQDAEDVAAETFVRAVAHLATYRFPMRAGSNAQAESLYPWLARIATNLILDQGRRFSAPTVSLDSGSAGGVRTYIENLQSDTPDPHTLAARQETQTYLRTAIATLPHEQGEAILLRFGGDLPLKEIALALGKTEGAVKSLLHRALANLRKTLCEAEDEATQFNARRMQYNSQQEQGRHSITSPVREKKD